MGIYIVGAKRTPIGSFLGSLKDISASDLGAITIESALNHAKLKPTTVDEVIMGQVLSTGQKQGVARQASIKAMIPESVPAYGVNMVCGSGMKAIMTAYTEMKSGMADIIVAGGVESMSQAPYFLPAKIRSGNKMGNMTMIDSLLYDALTDSFSGEHMGITAENIAEAYMITREQQDQFAVDSQKKAIEAVENHLFESEIVPVEVTSKRESKMVKVDEYPNHTTSIEKLASLRPAFKENGTVTAGNASGINDGASATVIVSEQAVVDHNVTPLVEIVGIGQGGVSPDYMGLGPLPAIDRALNQANLTLADIDVIELNEAFAAQSLGVIHELSKVYDISETDLLNKTNKRGGAIALGHPLGASGNRIVVTLLHIMKSEGHKYGLASLCIGGGMGVAIILKNCYEH